ncbi:hypothetical protein L1987_43479 [Smallanthus sonchifolius]|uniref:Uncharacterized protein n=1 Tax=Smallanthus sonchifolius TaxID=185202 RepID=A0ACB9GLN6_9ASTR|nr:hypothetical protein L1987_43479 [Smallanthus sonchifolius]
MGYQYSVIHHHIKSGKVIEVEMSIQGRLYHHLMMMMMVEDTSLDVQVPGEMAGVQVPGEMAGGRHIQIREVVLMTNCNRLHRTGSQMQMLLLLDGLRDQGLGPPHLISQLHISGIERGG